MCPGWERIGNDKPTVTRGWFVPPIDLLMVILGMIDNWVHHIKCHWLYIVESKCQQVEENYEIGSEVAHERQEHPALLSSVQFLALSHIGISAPCQILSVFLNVCWVCVFVSSWIFQISLNLLDTICSWLLQMIVYEGLWYPVALHDVLWYAPLS